MVLVIANMIVGIAIVYKLLLRPLIQVKPKQNSSLQPFCLEAMSVSLALNPKP